MGTNVSATTSRIESTLHPMVINSTVFYNGQKAQEKAAGWSGTVVRKFSTLQGASDAYRLMQGKRDASGSF